MESLCNAIECVLSYAVSTNLLHPSDVGYSRNLILDALRLSEPPPPGGTMPASHLEALAILSAYAAASGIVMDLPSERERFEVRVMGFLTPSPEAFRRTFGDIEARGGIVKACEWFDHICIASGYINETALKRNLKFFAPSVYGALEITINLAKPEKDPRDIAALANASASADEYPPCMLCPENEGYAGRIGFPARQTLRTLPVELDGEQWHFQYSPYRYFPEHCIVFAQGHTPMKIDAGTFRKLLGFLGRFPHYVIGSNADLPIVGGSVLNHNHFQGGQHIFPMDKAAAIATACHPMYPRVRVEALRWPMSAIRLVSTDAGSLTGLAELIRTAWQKYSDPVYDILANTGNVRHNTVTPTARRVPDGYQLDLVLRNNRATPEHPLGIFHPHAELHHVKKENIGLIEVMGMFILPGRLQGELEGVKQSLMKPGPYTPYDESSPLSKHNEWIESLIKRYGGGQPADAAERIAQDALAEKCVRVLEDAGVYKQDDRGRVGFMRFMENAGFMVR